MSQFCIDLRDVSLPDAIAAVVEAWYDAQMQEIAWEDQIRNDIRQKHGSGYVLRSVGKSRFHPFGKAQLTYRNADSKKASIVLPYEWKEENAADIHRSCLEICDEARLVRRHGI